MKTPKILIIEDDPYVQRMYQRTFSFEKFEIVLASSGEEGLTLAKKEIPDLILLDIILPGKNGLEVLADLKNNAKLKKIPVLMLTNVGEPEIEKEARKMGADCYLVKADFSPEAIIGEVRKHL